MYKCICNKIFAGEKPIGVFKQLTEGKEYEIEKEEIVKFPKKVNKKTGEVKKYEEIEMVKLVDLDCWYEKKKI